MKTINLSEIKIEQVQRSDIKLLAQTLTDWQNNPEFMQYLIESPMDIEWNIKFLEKKMSWDLTSLYVATYQDKIASILSIHSYIPDEKSVEETIRVAPDKQWLWIWTLIKDKVFQEQLQNPDIKSIISRHSAWNKWTFWTNKKCWWELTDFVEEYVMLSNRWVMTDAFKWEIKKEKNQEKDLLNLVTWKYRDRVINGLYKHSLIK